MSKMLIDRALLEQALKTIESWNPSLRTDDDDEAAITALRAALAQEEPAAKPLTVVELRRALVNVDLVDADAIDDPDGYDAGITMSCIDALYEWLKEKTRE
jgi:hypothetical protein